MESKTCNVCKEDKCLSSFYRQKGNKDSRAGLCKDCHKNRMKERWFDKKQDPSFVEKEKERGRDKYYRLYKGQKADPDLKRKGTKNYRNKYPEKYKAIISAQRLPKINPNNHLHHWSYNEEHYVDVIEIEPELHYKLHRFMTYDKSKKMYKDDGGFLLDTKEKHMNFIEEVKTRK